MLLLVEKPNIRVPILAANPQYFSTAEEVASDMHYHGYEPFGIVTSSNPEETASALASTLGRIGICPSLCAVLVIGGDGTTNNVRLAMKTPEVQGLTQGLTPLSSVGGGFAGDSRRGEHGERRKNPTDILKRGVVVPAWYMTREIQHPDGTITSSEASLYGGTGKTGNAAEKTNDATAKEQPRLVRALRIGLGTTFEDSSIQIQLGKNKPMRVGDVTVSVSGHMAMAGKLPTRLWHGDLQVFITKAGRAASAVGALCLLTGIPIGEKHSDTFEFTVLDPAKTHVDGEPPTDLEEGCVVRYALSPDTYPILTTRMVPRLSHAIGRSRASYSFASNDRCAS